MAAEDTVSMGLDMSQLFHRSYENNLEITSARGEPIAHTHTHTLTLTNVVIDTEVTKSPESTSTLYYTQHYLI